MDPPLGDSRVLVEERESQRCKRGREGGRGREGESKRERERERERERARERAFMRVISMVGETKEV